jgi:ABC-type glycerol-3-phosphate transport system substrate-binding protein
MPIRLGILHAAPLAAAALLAAACSPPAKVRMLAHMSGPAQKAHFQSRVIKPFEKKHDVIVDLVTYDDPGRLPALLSAPGDTFDLVNPPLEMTRALVARGLVAPLDEFVPAGDLADLRKEYFLLDLGRAQGRQYFVPRYLETPTLIYLKSHVAEAAQYWEIRRAEIDRILARHNGKGLPTGYVLEKDPSAWDAYDIFVAGYYWSQKEVKGQRRGRIALGPMDAPRLAQGLMDKAFQMGATHDGVLRMDDDAVADMFQWQGVLLREGVINPNLPRHRWTADRIRQGFRSGEIFLCEGTQTDAFLIHGNGTRELPGMLDDPEDMGLAVMPKGASLSLDGRGLPLREGRRNVGTRGWWWGVTRRSARKPLAFKLVRHLGGMASQIEEGTAFGVVSARQDLLGEMGLMFGGGWTSEVFQVASQQMVENRHTIAPLVDAYDAMAGNYVEAWRELCLPGAGRKTDFPHIRRTLEERYAPRQRAILGDRYPDRTLSRGLSPGPASDRAD